MQAHSVHLIRLPEAPGQARWPGPSLLSVLGAYGQDAQILCEMNTQASLLGAVHPMAGSDLQQADLEDWSRELNNQLLGRLKNKLLPYGCELALGIPTVVSGDQLSSTAAPGLVMSWFRAELGGKCMNLTIGLQVKPDCTLHEPEPGVQDDNPMLEGALALF